MLGELQLGVVGCGVMGAGIAQVCAQAGYQIVVSEISNGSFWLGKLMANYRVTEQNENQRDA